MMLSSFSIAPPSYYEGLADELDTISDAVRNHPRLNQHFAARLGELARQMRDDARLMQLSRLGIAS
jgi:hypothetical protein